MSKKFSDLAVSAMSAYEAVAQAEYELERARDQAVASAKAVVSALRATPRGKAALADQDGDVWIYSLAAEGEDYMVEVIPGDFDVPDRDGDEPAAPIEPEPEPEPVLDAYAEFAVS